MVPKDENRLFKQVVDVVLNQCWKLLKQPSAMQDVVKKVLSLSLKPTDAETMLWKLFPSPVTATLLSHHVSLNQVSQYTLQEVPVVLVPEPTAMQQSSIKVLFAKPENVQPLISLVLTNLNVTLIPNGLHAHEMLMDIALQIKKSDMFVATLSQIIDVIANLASAHGPGLVVTMFGLMLNHGTTHQHWDTVSSNPMMSTNVMVSANKSVNQFVRMIHHRTTLQMSSEDPNHAVFKPFQVS